jgi:transposase
MKSFRPFDLQQRLLLPPDLQDWLPEGHLARFVAEVVGELDLSAVYAGYGDGRGQAAYHPQMMAGLLIYGYCTGIFSSRRIERATHEDVAFRYLSGDQHPDHDTIAAFRERHLEALKGLFVQVLKLCERAGLVALGHVALDGSKVKANASLRKTMRYEHMAQREAALAGQVARLVEQATAIDAAEDQQYGAGKGAQQLPAELARAQQRLAKIRAAKAALENEAREAAQRLKTAAEATMAARARHKADTGTGIRGRKPKMPDPATAKPESSAQRNLTDPDAQIMIDGATKSFTQAYNAQIAVDAAHQIIVAETLTTQANDQKLLTPMLAQVATNLGRKPAVVSADTGFYADAQLTDPRLDGIDLYIPPQRQPGDRPPDDDPPPPTAPHSPSTPPPPPRTASDRRTAMRAKLLTTAGNAIYRLRKTIVEPVFGQTKYVRGFRQFLLRGKTKTRAEWSLVCTTHNLLKLWRFGQQPA